MLAVMHILNLLPWEGETSRDPLFTRLNILSCNILCLKSHITHYFFYPEHHESSEKMWMVAARLCLVPSAALGEILFSFQMYQECLKVQKVRSCAKLINSHLCIFCDYA